MFIGVMFTPELIHGSIQPNPLPTAEHKAHDHKDTETDFSHSAARSVIDVVPTDCLVEQAHICVMGKLLSNQSLCSGGSVNIIFQQQKNSPLILCSPGLANPCRINPHPEYVCQWTLVQLHLLHVGPYSLIVLTELDLFKSIVRHYTKIKCKNSVSLHATGFK